MASRPTPNRSSGRWIESLVDLTVTLLVAPPTTVSKLKIGLILDSNIDYGFLILSSQKRKLIEGFFKYIETLCTSNFLQLLKSLSSLF